MSARPQSPLDLPARFDARNEAGTAELAGNLAASLRAGDVLLLEGSLGVGKTAFARALIRILTGNPELEVPSPTFTLLQTYESPEAPVWHFDLYRLKDPEEIYELGWEDGLGSAILLIEWPERLGALRPENTITLTLSGVPGNTEARLITIDDRRTASHD